MNTLSDSYTVARNGKTIGKFTREEIIVGLQNGAVSPNDHCWAPGFKSWRTVQEAILAPQRAAGKFTVRACMTHLAACLIGALTYGLASSFLGTTNIPAEAPATSTVIAAADRPAAIQPATATIATPEPAQTPAIIETAPANTKPEQQIASKSTSPDAPKAASSVSRFERLAKSPIKLAPINPSNKGPLRISGCIASNIDILYLSWPVRVNDELPSSNMVSTFEDMEKRCIEKPSWNSGNGALALTIVLENKSKYVIQSPVITAALLDENGDRIASGSYTGQSGAPFVTLAPGDRACYRLVIKTAAGNTLEEKAGILAKFSKVEFAVFVGSQAAGLTQSEWIETAPK